MRLRFLKLIAGKEIVFADETTRRVQEKGRKRTARLWSFIGRDEVERELIANRGERRVIPWIQIYSVWIGSRLLRFSRQ